MSSGCKGNAGFRIPASSLAIRKSLGAGKKKEGTQSDCYHSNF